MNVLTLESVIVVEPPCVDECHLAFAIAVRRGRQLRRLGTAHTQARRSSVALTSYRGAASGEERYAPAPCHLAQATLVFGQGRDW